MTSIGVDESLRLHEWIILQSGGSLGLRDRGLLESALAQPFQTFGSEDLYPSIIDKAAALGFHLVSNHAFTDGNKRIGHAVMEAFLKMNGLEINAAVGEQEQAIYDVAAGKVDREGFTEWLRRHVTVSSAE